MNSGPRIFYCNRLSFNHLYYPFFDELLSCMISEDDKSVITVIFMNYQKRWWGLPPTEFTFDKDFPLLGRMLPRRFPGQCLLPRPIKSSVDLLSLVLR